MIGWLKKWTPFGLGYRSPRDQRFDTSARAEMTTAAAPDMPDTAPGDTLAKLGGRQ